MAKTQVKRNQGTRPNHRPPPVPPLPDQTLLVFQPFPDLRLERPALPGSRPAHRPRPPSASPRASEIPRAGSYPDFAGSCCTCTPKASRAPRVLPASARSSRSSRSRPERRDIPARVLAKPWRRWVSSEGVRERARTRISNLTAKGPGAGRVPSSLSPTVSTFAESLQGPTMCVSLRHAPSVSPMQSPQPLAQAPSSEGCGALSRRLCAPPRPL